MAGWSGTRPSAFVKVVEADLKAKRNQIAAEALQMVVAASPVDTGAFRGSHRVSINQDDTGFDASHTDASGQATIDAGLAVIDKADQPYQAVIVQTNLPYSEALEAGHSQQAPSGVYRPTYSHLRAKHAKQ